MKRVFLLTMLLMCQPLFCWNPLSVMSKITGLFGRGKVQQNIAPDDINSDWVQVGIPPVQPIEKGWHMVTGKNKLVIEDKTNYRGAFLLFADEKIVGHKRNYYKVPFYPERTVQGTRRFGQKVFFCVPRPGSSLLWKVPLCSRLNDDARATLYPNVIISSDFVHTRPLTVK